MHLASRLHIIQPTQWVVCWLLWKYGVRMYFVYILVLMKGSRYWDGEINVLYTLVCGLIIFGRRGSHVDDPWSSTSHDNLIHPAATRSHYPYTISPQIIQAVSIFRYVVVSRILRSIFLRSLSFFRCIPLVLFSSWGCLWIINVEARRGGLGGGGGGEHNMVWFISHLSV